MFVVAIVWLLPKQSSVSCQGFEIQSLCPPQVKRRSLMVWFLYYLDVHVSMIYGRNDKDDELNLDELNLKCHGLLKQAFWSILYYGHLELSCYQIVQNNSKSLNSQKGSLNLNGEAELAWEFHPLRRRVSCFGHSIDSWGLDQALPSPGSLFSPA